jgi:hypothetical protein
MTVSELIEQLSERPDREDFEVIIEHTLARLDSFILAVDGKRLTYERLTA